MNFLGQVHTVVGGRMWSASIARSLGAPLDVFVHEGPPTPLKLWWHPEPHMIQPGDRVLYFHSVNGVEYEAVQRPARKPVVHQHGGGVATVKFS